MKRTLLLSFSLLFFTAPVVFGQIELNTNGNVGVEVSPIPQPQKLTVKCIDNGNCGGSYAYARTAIDVRVEGADENYGITASADDGY